jgi:hypothetical protein
MGLTPIVFGCLCLFNFILKEPSKLVSSVRDIQQLFFFVPLNKTPTIAHSICSQGYFSNKSVPDGVEYLSGGQNSRQRYSIIVTFKA